MNSYLGHGKFWYTLALYIWKYGQDKGRIYHYLEIWLGYKYHLSLFWNVARIYVAYIIIWKYVRDISNIFHYLEIWKG